jgi:hypothetical protein
MKLVRPRRPIRALLLITVVLGLVLAYVLPASASHPEASLPGSNFEIDVNANLKVDDPAPSIDWASVTEARKTDLATGTNDDSYAGGTKEDDACPGTTPTTRATCSPSVPTWSRRPTARASSTCSGPGCRSPAAPR